MIQDSIAEIAQGLLDFYKTQSDRWPSPGPDVQICDLARISDGWETEVYAFAVEVGPGNDRTREERILRIYPGEGASQKAVHEFNVMRKLHAAGYPVPYVQWLETDGAFIGKPFVIMERIVGRSMGAIVAGLSGEARRAWMARFCRMYVDLHALDWRPFAPGGSPYETLAPAAAFAQQLSEWQAFTHTRGVTGFDPTFDWLRVRLPEVRFGPPSLLHWDYHYHNILVREADDAVFVIDWAGAMVSDYRVDLVWTMLLMSSHGWPEARDMVLEEYERAAGHRADSIAVFEVFACARRLFDISSTLLIGAAAAGLRPGAEAMIANAAHIGHVYGLLREKTGIAIAEIERLLSSLR